MITSIELGDFLAHSSTKLEFENGVTVFVGQNGAGKSSIIDAITFALFGQHTRKSNKGLIKRGTNQGFAKINFSVNGRDFEAARKIDTKGNLSAKLSELRGDNQIELAAGERKQFGESMTDEVEKIIGLDFEKLKIASIVQQGELNAIINAKPKEFKELLNAIIGINKLDVAIESMKTVNKEFRERIKGKIGYDDTHIDILSRDLERNQNEIEQSVPIKIKLEEEQKSLQKEVEKIRSRIETDTPKIDKIEQLKSRKKELISYAKTAMHEIQEEISENERKIRDCQGCFEHATQKEKLESKISKVEDAIEDTTKKIQEMAKQIAALEEKLTLAEKLQLKDNKCPVCDSHVDKLNPLFQEEHLKEEISTLKEQSYSKQKEKETYNEKRTEFVKKLRDAINAEATLRAHSISNKEELEKIQEDINLKRQKIPLTDSDNLAEISQIDSHAGMIFENIRKLEEETEDFDESSFLELKRTVEIKQQSLSSADQQLGAITEKISKTEENIDKIKEASEELLTVKDYMSGLEQIQTNVFSRDGPVATSLRSWALNTISAKASEHLELLNTKIQRIQLSEKTRDISITCHSKSETLDLESLSGGEKVSVAIALRLGMASLLGASNLNLMILDEPTTHLDAERKKSLVGVLSQLSDISNSEAAMQFLIITHDAEIFEDSAVERIYKFESGENGSKVIAI